MRSTTTAAPTRTDDRYPTRIFDEPRILDRIDPVVADSATDPGAGPLTSAQVRDFDRDGYLVLDDVFDLKEARRYLAELHRLSADEDLKREDRVVSERDTDEVRSIFEIHRVSELFRCMSEDPRLADVTRQLLGSDVTLHQTRVNFKPGFRGKEFYWHSDFETWHAEDGMPAPRAVSASVSLTDNVHTNGPLMVIAGSHRWFVSCPGETPPDHHRESLRRQEIGVPDDDHLAELARRGEIRDLVGPAGSVTFFECNLMHGSNGNITPLPRRNAFFVFNSVENPLVEPYAAPGPRPTHIASRVFTPLTH